MAGIFGNGPQETTSAEPCSPLTFKSMEDQIFLERAWQGGHTVLVNSMTGERQTLPTKNPDEQWRVVAPGGEGHVSLNNHVLILNEDVRGYVWALVPHGCPEVFP